MSVIFLNISLKEILQGFPLQVFPLYKFIVAVKHVVQVIESCRIQRSEFETIRLIGYGAFGEVSVVRWKNNNKIYALKSLHKFDMLKRSDVILFSVISIYRELVFRKKEM